MSTIILGSAGQAIGALFGPAGAMIGKAIGAAVGRMIDQSIIAILTPDKQILGPEVGQVNLAIPREGDMLSRGAGWQQLPARICWPEKLNFTEETEVVESGGKGAQNKTITTTYFAEVTIAIAVRDGRTDMIGRIWADGSLIDLGEHCQSVTWYMGDSTQNPDPTIEAVDGVGNVPDWRGATYVVLEGFNLLKFGNRIPQLQFETFSATRGQPRAYTGVTLLPTAGEFGLHTAKITEETTETVTESGGDEEVTIDNSPVNNNAASDSADILTTLKLLQAQHPQVTTITIEIPWFGNDLRCETCEIKPRVEIAARDTAPDVWQVNGIARGSVVVISQIDGAGSYAGTPSDKSVIALIKHLKAAGFTVTLSPLIIMDIAAGNALADPYGAAEQSAYPDRSMITVTPAIGQGGTVDKTATATTQISAFFGAIDAADYSVAGEVITYSGSGSDWGYNRFALHCAALVKAAGGLDAFLIGSDLSGVTKVRDAASAFPAVVELQSLLVEVQSLLDGVYSGAAPITHIIPALVDGAVLPYYDPLTTTPTLSWVGDQSAYDSLCHTSTFSEGGDDFDVGTQGYLLEHAAATFEDIFVDVPISPGKWRVDAAFDHAMSTTIGSSGARSWELREFLAGAGILTGGTPTDITDGKTVAAYPITGQPAWTAETAGGVANRGGDHIRFVYRFRDLYLLRDLVITMQRAIRFCYAADWQEYGAYVPDDGTGDVYFPLDDLWVDLDFVAINWRAPLADARDGDAASPYSLANLKAQIESGEYYDFIYASDADRQAQIETVITDAVYSEPWVYRAKDIYNWWSSDHHNRPLGVRDVAATSWIASDKPVVLFYGCPAIDRGANQPDVNLNTNSTEYALPHFSNGARDDDAQAAYLRAVAEYWTDDVRGVVDADLSCAVGWDARPWPIFPHTDLWPDAANWPVSVSMSGRQVVDIGSWLADEMDYRGLDYSLEQITGAIDGITIDNLAGFNAVAGQALGLFHLDAIEVDGRIVVTSRALQNPTDTIDLSAVIPISDRDRYQIEVGNPANLPQYAQMTHLDIGHEYDNNTVNSHLPFQGQGESHSEIKLLIDPQRAAGLLRAKHLDMRPALEILTVDLPPSWLDKIQPGRVVLADVGAGDKEWLILKREIGASIKTSMRRIDRSVLHGHPVRRIGNDAPDVGTDTSAALAMPDLPWIKYADSAHDLRVALWVNPAQGAALQRSLSESTGYELIDGYSSRPAMGVLKSDLASGSVYGWDRGNTLSVRMFSGILETRPETDVRSGTNWMAVQTDPVENTWELLAFRDAALISADTYDLTHLLRGLRGSQVVASIAAGARVVVLAGLPFAGVGLEEISTPFWWSGGPSSKPRTDPSWITKQVPARGVGLKPFSPARLSGEIVGVDLELSWMRRDRDPRAAQINRADIPMSEEALSYTVTIGASTWGVTTESATILSADLPATPFDVTVQQQSADVGLGFPATITIG